MTAEAFLDWCLGQEGRWELVDGVPVAMAGARRGHDLIVVNALTSLRPALRGGPCQPFTGDFAVRIPNGNIRRPDVGVDCGPVDLNGLTATDPRLVIEVLSPSTRTFDAIGRLREYRLRRNRARRTGPVLDNHRLTNVFRQLLRNQAGNPIC